MDPQDVKKIALGVATGIGLTLAAKRLMKYKPQKVWQNVSSGGKFASINAPTAGAREVKDLPVGKNPIQIYSLATPNGQKVSIMLEEIVAQIPDFDYDAHFINIGEGDQFTSGFVDVNPNSKIPCLVDNSASPPIKVFETGSILIYLAEKFPKLGLLPTETSQRTEVINWLMWQMGSAPYLGGGFGHFYAYAPEKFEYPINRFSMEAKRQMDVLDKQLAKNKYVAGDSYSIADIAIWPWYGQLALGRLYDAAEFLNVAEYKNVVRWAKDLEANREAVRKGRMVNRWAPDTDNPLYADIPALKNRFSKEDWTKPAEAKQ